MVHCYIKFISGPPADVSQRVKESYSLLKEMLSNNVELFILNRVGPDKSGIINVHIGY